MPAPAKTATTTTTTINPAFVGMRSGGANGGLFGLTSASLLGAGAKATWLPDHDYVYIDSSGNGRNSSGQGAGKGGMGSGDALYATADDGVLANAQQQQQGGDDYDVIAGPEFEYMAPEYLQPTTRTGKDSDGGAGEYLVPVPRGGASNADYDTPDAHRSRVSSGGAVEVEYAVAQHIARGGWSTRAGRQGGGKGDEVGRAEEEEEEGANAYDSVDVHALASSLAQHPLSNAVPVVVAAGRELSHAGFGFDQDRGADQSHEQGSRSIDSSSSSSGISISRRVSTVPHPAAYDNVVAGRGGSVQLSTGVAIHGGDNAWDAHGDESAPPLPPLRQRPKSRDGGYLDVQLTTPRRASGGNSGGNSGSSSGVSSRSNSLRARPRVVLKARHASTVADQEEC